VHRFGHGAVAWSIVAVSWLFGQHYAVRVAGAVHPYFGTCCAQQPTAITARMK
jgi:hypothetical protein